MPAWCRKRAEKGAEMRQEMSCHRERAGESAELALGDGGEVISSTLCHRRNPLS